MINIYCDESCHLEQDKSSCMILGAITCPKEISRSVAEDLRYIKSEAGFSSKFELKWTKVGSGAIDYYKRVIDYFFDNSSLSFRAVVADKTQLRHEDFAQTHDDWYYKMYYLLLHYLVLPTEKYKVYIDIKDTRGGEKVQKLKDILNHSLYAFYDETIQGVQQIRSEESELLQLADLLIGAVGYRNRNLYQSNSKLTLCQQIEEQCSHSLLCTSPLSERKVNILKWQAR